jgi:hypothetical protein
MRWGRVGGTERTFPEDEALVLDASFSRDLDVDPALSRAADLAFTWTCTIGSLNADFGAACGVFEGGFLEVYDSAVVLREGTLKSNVTYWFQVNVAAADGRSATKRIVVTPVGAESVSSLHHPLRIRGQGESTNLPHFHVTLHYAKY